MREDGKIDYIELPGTDLPATKGFYQQAFAWTFIDYGPQYAAFDNGGVDGGFNADPADRTKAPLMMVQWLRFGSGGLVQMFGIARKDQWADVLPRMRALRDGFEPK